jgi:putative endonuclease
MAAPEAIWHLYLIRCADGSLYTGITTDVARRLDEHRANRGARRLRGRQPLQLVFSREIGNHGAALRVERCVKALRKTDKERLVLGQLPLSDLFLPNGNDA